MIPIIPIRLRSLVWLWLTLLAVVLPQSLGLASIGKSDCKVVYDGQGFASTGYDGCSLRAFDYDSATVLTVDRGTDSTGHASALFEKSAEFLAAKGTTTLQPMADAAFQTGSIRTIAGYETAGNAGLVGNTYNVNLWGMYATDASQGPFAFVNALKAEASAAGANQISIAGLKVLNTDLLNISPKFAERLGLEFRQISSETILLQGEVH